MREKLNSDNRTYHFQAEDESDQRAWLSVLVNCKDTALRRAFDDSGGKTNESSSLWELQQAIIRLVQRLPGNHACCDCNSMNGVEIYVNLYIYNSKWRLIDFNLK